MLQLDVLLNGNEFSSHTYLLKDWRTYMLTPAYFTRMSIMKFCKYCINARDQLSY